MNRTSSRRGRRLAMTKGIAIVAAAGLFAAACGSDDEGGASPEDTQTVETDDSANASGDSAPPETDAEVAPSGEGESIRLWLNGGDTPDELVDFAVTEFNVMHPDVEVVFERQQWDGIVERLTTALSSNDSPDVVEFGNTQAQSFEAAGAVNDLTAMDADFGGDDLLQSLKEAGTYDGALYGVPYYAGARIMIYRKDLFADAGVEVPTTMEETLTAGITLKEANADTPNFSGFYLPGKNWYAMLSFLWENGGDIAVQEDGEWVGQLTTPKSIAGLEFFAEVFNDANGAPADGDDANDYLAFCNGEVAMMPAPGWKPGQITNPDDGCPELEDQIGVFALPGYEAGSTAPVFLGGSVLAVPANSEHPELAADLIQVMVSAEFQSQFAEIGTIPSLLSQLEAVSGSDAAVAQAEAAQNSRFVPTSENWAGVEAANILPDMLVTIAQGGDIEDAAAQANSSIEDLLNG